MLDSSHEHTSSAGCMVSSSSCTGAQAMGYALEASSARPGQKVAQHRVRDASKSEVSLAILLLRASSAPSHAIPDARLLGVR